MYYWSVAYVFSTLFCSPSFNLKSDNLQYNTVWTVNDVLSRSTPFLELSRSTPFFTAMNGVDRLNSKNGVDRLKTSLTVHTVCVAQKADFRIFD